VSILKLQKELFYYIKNSDHILSYHCERSETISLKQTRLRRHVVPYNNIFFIQSNDVIPKTNLAVIPDLIRYPERPKLAPHVQITRVSRNQTCHSRIFKENIRYPDLK